MCEYVPVRTSTYLLQVCAFLFVHLFSPSRLLPSPFLSSSLSFVAQFRVGCDGYDAFMLMLVYIFM